MSGKCPVCNQTPQPVGALGDPGVSPCLSRCDHVHEGVHRIIGGEGIGVSPASGRGDVTLTAGVPGFGGIPPAIASAGSGGVAGTASRSDHTHEGVHQAIPGADGSIVVAPVTGLGDVTFTTPAGSIRDWRQVGTSPETYHTNAGSMLAPVTQVTGTAALVALPYYEGRGGTIDRIAAEVTTGVANAVARLGLYKATSKTNLYPGALVVDSGELDFSTAGVKIATINVTLERNTLYYLTSLLGTAAPTCRAIASAQNLPLNLGIIPAFGATPWSMGWTRALAYGALPNPFTAGGALLTAGNRMMIGLRYSA